MDYQKGEVYTFDGVERLVIDIDGAGRPVTTGCHQTAMPRPQGDTDGQARLDAEPQADTRKYKQQRKPKDHSPLTGGIGFAYKQKHQEGQA